LIQQLCPHTDFRNPHTDYRNSHADYRKDNRRQEPKEEKRGRHRRNR
jgi:hypothetical protein